MATVMFKGSPVTLLGNEVKVGQAAPDFKVQKSADMSDYTLASAGGKDADYCHSAFAGHPGVRPRNQAIQRGSQQACQRRDRLHQHGLAVRAEALVRRRERR